MKQQFYDAIVDGPIIAAVKDETGVEVCIQNDIRVVFILYGELITIPDIVQRLKDAGKFVIVHLDLIGGLAGRAGSSTGDRRRSDLGEGGRHAGTGCGSDCDFNDKPGSVENVTDTVYQEKGVRVCVIQLRKKLRIVSGS